MFDFQPEEFIVEEIARDGTVFELNQPVSRPGDPGKFTHFILQKRLWNTVQALQALADRLHVRAQRFDFAGTKDRHAVTTQLCSAFAIPSDRLRGLALKDVKILGAWSARDKIRLGDLGGNRFTLTLTEKNTGRPVDAKRIAKRAKASNHLVPNFFGDQRFGSLRRNTHLVGQRLLRGDAEAAVKNFLCFVDENEALESRQARETLAAGFDYARALDHFPPHLKYERDLIAYLREYPHDYAGAFRKLPRKLQLMFVHAFQSHVFNQALRQRLADGELFTAKKGDWFYPANQNGFPEKTAEEIASAAQAKKTTAAIAKRNAFLAGKLIGYESKLSKDDEKLLKKEGVKQADFQLKAFPELSSKGVLRPLFVPLVGFKILSENPCVLRFSLPPGAYATTALDHLLGA